ncbi:MAG: hypothetical protein FJ216_11030 [Ignavibacteria bacterium]|nr:hypothetical protein [Ignavibacteria bacterium]
MRFTKDTIQETKARVKSSKKPLLTIKIKAMETITGTAIKRQSYDRTDRKKQQDLILEFLNGGKFNAWELAKMSGLLITSVRARLNELQKAGKVKISGIRYYGPTERNISVYEKT